MTSAMHKEGLEPPIIEDLVNYGRDRWLEQGRREGLEAGRREGVEVGRREELDAGLRLARESLLDLLSTCGLSPTAEDRLRIGEERALERIHEWLRRAVRAKSMSDVFGQRGPTVAGG